MGKIRASLSDISTEFQPIEPGIYEYEIVKVEEKMDGDELKAYIVTNKVTTPGDFFGKTVRDYINLRTKDGGWSEAGLATIKRYFEVTHGKDTVAEWTDDDYDTDLLQGKQFQAQTVIDSYTPAGQTEPRKNNKFTRMEPLG